jgi:hypothetical protein
VLSVSLDCLFDSVFLFVQLCCQFLWIVYLIPCLSSFTCVVSFSGLSIWFRVCLRAPVLSQHRWTKTNTESNRQSRETDNTGGRRQTRNQIDNPEKLTTQVDEDKHGIRIVYLIPCLSSFTCVVSFSGLSIWFRVCLRPPVMSVSLDCLFDSVFVFVPLCCQFLWIVYLIPCLSSFTCVVSFSGLSIWQVDKDKHGIK